MKGVVTMWPAPSHQIGCLLIILMNSDAIFLCRGKWFVLAVEFLDLACHGPCGEVWGLFLARQPFWAYT